MPETENRREGRNQPDAETSSRVEKKTDAVEGGLSRFGFLQSTAEGGGISPRLALARKGMNATSPTIPYRTIIYTDPTTTWDCEISSHHYGSTGEREVEPGVRPMPSNT